MNIIDVSPDDQWLPIPGFSGLYEAHPSGRVRGVERMVVVADPRTGGRYQRLIRAREIAQNLSPSGYFIVKLYKHGKCYTRSVSRLVLLTFVGPCPNGWHCCHNDGDKENNSLANLRWDSPAGNAHDKIAHGTQVRGEAQGSSKLAAADILVARQRYRDGESAESIASDLPVGPEAVRRLLIGRTWAHVGVPVVMRSSVEHFSRGAVGETARLRLEG